jgi:lipopolysaccharide export system ATP-binding protein
MLNILEVDSVTKSFGYNNVLTDIYLKCQTGDVLGVLGRNGAGKSTLLKILFGTLSADNKFIRIDGKIRKYPYKTNNELCYLPQFSFIPKHLTMEMAVKLCVENGSIDHFFDDQILDSLRENKVSNLSGGELRYLEIKLLLKTKSKFVLLDEPFNGVSPLLIQSIKIMISESSKTKGVILTDHDYENVIDVSNRCCLISDGGLKQIEDKVDLVKWGYISGSRI